MTIVVLAMMFVFGGSSQAAAATETTQNSVPFRWLQETAADGTAAGWYRMSFSFDPAHQSATIQLASDGVCTLSVNGQRLLKHVSFAATEDGRKAIGFDLTSLLRTGRNSIAMELRSTQPGVLCAIALTARLQETAPTNINGDWKKAPSMPPAGWQQTDFNDRDWVNIEPPSSPPKLAFPVVRAVEFRPAVPRTAAPRTPFRFEDGDHVILLGATFLEREQQYGCVEAALSGAVGAKRVTFRNLGWDGDTVFAESRGIFDPPAQGYLRMIEQIRAEEPTVILICYGQNDALDPRRTVEQFQTQLHKLLKDLSTTGAVIELVSPHELFPAVPPVPSPSRFNPRIKEFTAAVRRTAAFESLGYIDLFDRFTFQLAAADDLIRISEPKDEIPPDPIQHPDLWALAASRWTANGMHLNDRGYQAAALVVRDRLLGIPAAIPEIRIDLPNRSIRSVTTSVDVRNIHWQNGDAGMVSFEIHESVLSPLPIVLQFDNPAITVSGTVAEDRSDADVLRLVPESGGRPKTASRLIPANPQYQRLVSTVVRKNELYFHRWRPQNITYLFGFRKHEQGNNAAEIVQFDPLIAALEEEIHQQQLPTSRTVTLHYEN